MRTVVQQYLVAGYTPESFGVAEHSSFIQALSASTGIPQSSISLEIQSGSSLESGSGSGLESDMGSGLERGVGSGLENESGSGFESGSGSGIRHKRSLGSSDEDG